MTETRAWLRQARSDYEAIGRVLDPGDSSTYCQALAKCQQAVEKSVKAFVAALRDAGVLDIEIGFGHNVLRFLDVLILMPHARENPTLQRRVHRFFDHRVRDGIRSLDRLAPRRPQPGTLPARNTEYPFQSTHGDDWNAPAESDVFSIEEVARFRLLAHDLLRECSVLVTAAERIDR